MRPLERLAALACVPALVGIAVPAHADETDKMGGKLVSYEAEVKQIGAAVRSTKSFKTHHDDVSERRLINAQVAFGIGNYDDAAIMLYDLVEKGPGSRSYDEAVYFLAESLFQKKDYMGARNYFLKLLDDVGAKSDYYQQALERLIELSLKLHDDTDVASYLSALASIPADQQRSSVPYVRGRYQYFSGDYAGAVQSFDEIKSTSDYFVRSRYFAGAAHVALGDLAAASKIYENLIRRQPKDDTDRRVVELSHMALGRIFYERDQASQAVDQYLMVSRKSDLFDQALYEVAWVYVKDKQYDKALRALELLALANPESAVLPDVRILEGNLRIRKARMIAESGMGNSLEEFDHAMTVFTETRDTFEHAHEAIDRIVKENEDPRKFVNQITGRSSETFDVEAQLPQVAVEMLREEAEVSRVIDVDSDLVGIRQDVESTEETIKRLERAIDSPSKVNIFPELAEKRARLTEIFEDVSRMRAQLTITEGALVEQVASAAERSELEQLRAKRAELGRELAALPGADMKYSDRVQEARAKYGDLAARSAEIAVLLDANEATLVAIQKYLADEKERTGDLQRAEQFTGTIDEIEKDVAALRAELELIHEDITLGHDQAGVGDETAVRAKQLREEYREAVDAEHQFLATITGRMSGGDRTKADQIGNLLSKGAQVLGDIDLVEREIDRVVDAALGETRTAIAEEKRKLDGYRAELERYETDAQELGGAVLSANFGRVSEKFYEVLIRSDVGVIDVAWASKEQAETTLKRLTLEESRERRVLQEQFSDVVKPPPPTKPIGDDEPAPGGDQ